MTRLLPLLALLIAVAPAAQINTGDPVPAVAQSALMAGAGQEGLVVVFWSQACPWTDRYAPRLADLVDGYSRAGFGFVLVGSTLSGVDTEVAGLGIPIVGDVDGAFADAFGAARAPHAFLFGPDMTLLYDGAVDDSPASATRVRTPYLAQAMDQSIADLPIEIQRTQSFGCTIARDSE